MNKPVNVYNLLILYNLLSLVGFIFLMIFLKFYAESLITKLGKIWGTFASMFRILVFMDLYFLFLSIVFFIGFMIVRNKENKVIQSKACKLQSTFMLIIWVGFSGYWLFYA